MTAQLDGPGTELPVFSSVCAFCKHLRVDEGRTCDAFPERDSIPRAIWLGENDHQAPYPGDHGIRFKPVDTEYARQRFGAPRPAERTRG